MNEDLRGNLSFGEDNAEYNEFVDKFKKKRTSDDCYTPQNVYEAVVSWCEKEYNIDRNKIVRPFYPNGDYKTFQYGKDCIVLDNPPFSILAEIVRFYVENNIKFFLFAPSLTLFNSCTTCTAVCVGAEIIYENKANINTSFVTNMNGKTRLRSAPSLYQAIKAANEENQGKKRPTPKYKYPAHVVTAASISYLSKYGIEFSVDELETQRIAALDEQIKVKKMIFGSGYLLCNEKARENEISRRLAEINSDMRIWNLSDAELKKVEELDRGHAELLRIRREEFRQMGQE
jgi:hypothetical protein